MKYSVILATYKGFQVLKFSVRVGEGLKILLSLKKKKKDEKQILCFRTKTAHIEQSLFDPIGPFSYILSHIYTYIHTYIYTRKMVPIC